MGVGVSTEYTPKNVQFLIGDTRRMSEAERRFYSLSEYVLQKNDNYVGSTCPALGFVILTAQPHNSSSSCDHTNAQSISNKKIKIINEIVLTCNSEQDVNIVSEEDISMQEQSSSSLYVILPLHKKLYATQTFIQWRTLHGYENLFSCCCSLKRTIYLQPIDNFPNFIDDFEIKLDSFRHHLNLFTLLQTFAEAFFTGMTVRVLPSASIMRMKWNITSRVHSVTGQKQLKVSDFHSKLKAVRPNDGYCIMGIIWTDLYPTEDLNFILGEALNSHKTGIFCFGRREPKSYNAETHKDISEVDGALIWRLLKVLTHETCHLFGLDHCEYFCCAMNESGSLAQAFAQPLFLCPVCLRKLQYACDFDVLHRYRALLRIVRDLSKIFPTPQLIAATKWLTKCIAFLEYSGDDSVVTPTLVENES